MNFILAAHTKRKLKLHVIIHKNQTPFILPASIKFTLFGLQHQESQSV